MTPLRVQRAAGHVLRSSTVLRFTRASRIKKKIRMTANSPNHHLWHRNRGITFASGPRSEAPSSDALRSYPFSTSAAALVSTTTDHEKLQLKSGDDYVTYQTLPATDGTAAERVDETRVGKVDRSSTSWDGQTVAQPAISSEIPYPALDWKVSEELFRSAKQAPSGAQESYWSYTLYRGPGEDGSERKVKVHYCRSKHTTERVLREYFMNEKVIGFDLEWMADSNKNSGVKRNVSLIQLASPSRIALLHVALFTKSECGDYVAPSLKKIMEDSQVTKVGVWIKGDATRLRNYMNIQSRGLMELSHLYKLVTYSQTGQFKNINKRLIPLATQVEHYLHLPMFKGQDVRSSDWTQPLRMDQIIYSASDAYAGVQLFAALEHARTQLDPCPPTPHHAELNLPIRIADNIDLETDSEEELAEQPLEGPPTERILSPAARKRQLRELLRSVKDTIYNAKSAIQEAEEFLEKPKDPRITAAESWTATFKAENQASETTQSKLRAYHIWHTNKNMDVDDVAQLLRDPPLKKVTVAKYISFAIEKEDLPKDQARFDREIKPHANGRYGWFRV